MKKSISTEPLLYLRIAQSIEQQIYHEVLQAGDKLPSIRMVCREHGVSMSTAQMAYHELERKLLIEAKPQSGYYVRQPLKRRLAIPETSNPENKSSEKQLTNILTNVYNNRNQQGITLFSMGLPAPELLPVTKLNKALVEATKQQPINGARYEPIAGHSKLRRQIAKWSFSWQGNLSEEDIITTAGCINAISYCLMALTKRGDTIAVESPCYYGTLQLAQSLGLRVLELPTHPQTGIEIEALKQAIVKDKIKLCILVSNFSNPLGSCMPMEHKKEVVKLIQYYNIPLIEDDLYGDIYFGNSRPTCCRSYDESGLVLWCGSVSKTLAPGYRVGWVAPGKFKRELLEMKLFHSLSSTTVTQQAIATFLESGRYEAHLRKLRRALHTTYLHYINVISKHFPTGTKVSCPQGGLSLWVELNKQIDTIDLYDKAMQYKISIAPGSMYTLQNQYNNCMRLSYGLLWNRQLEEDLKLLGKLVTTFG